MRAASSSGLFILWLCILLLSSRRVSFGFEIRTTNPQHGRFHDTASSSFPFSITTSSRSSLLDGPSSHLRIRQPAGGAPFAVSSTELTLFRRIWRRLRGRKNKKEEAVEDVEIKDTTPPEPPQVESTKIHPKKPKSIEKASICLIGGGVSGLAAALTAGEILQNSTASNKKIVLLESSHNVGGRVQSDVTDDGYTLDRGFAVFIEEYPVAKKILDYEALKLGQFLPGALVKVPDSQELARVADPFRQPEELLDSVTSPVGSISDKLALLPLILKIKAQSVESIFREEETNTLDALTRRWFFSDVMLEEFFKPFLEGIYLAPLEQQSSRMFNFVFKMFTDGAAALPQGGMGQVSQQLADHAKSKGGVDIRTSQAVSKLSRLLEEDGGGYLVETADGKTRIQADVVIIATDGVVSQKIVSQMDGFESLESLPTQPQRSVGCLYYSFEGDAPVQDPILILNGMGKGKRGSNESPVNNICFPSVVNKGYAPDGCSLCSVTILEPAMSAYKGQENQLDAAVRKQLATWFPDNSQDILNKWKLQRVYRIPNAQPGQLDGPYPANVNGGRDCNTFWGKELPAGLLVCGDHMATATLNGALESGVKAGEAAAKAAK